MNVQDITSADWSLAITKQGAIVDDLADINQCIYIILTTDRGSDPLRPLFGNNILRYVDKPLNSAIPNIIREIVEAIRLWEPRVNITKIKHTLVDNEKLQFSIEWKTVSASTGTTILTL